MKKLILACVLFLPACTVSVLPDKRVGVDEINEALGQRDKVVSDLLQVTKALVADYNLRHPKADAKK